MAAILRERQIMATNIDSLNHSFKGTVDFDGGNVMALAYGADDVMTATVPATGNLKGLAMAYNPSVRYIKVGNKTVAGGDISVDERDYTNLAGIVGDCFIPQPFDEIGLTAEAIDGVTAPTVGKFLEAANGKKTLTIAESQTADVLSLKVVRIDQEQFPKAGIGHETVPLYICQVVAN